MQGDLPAAVGRQARQHVHLVKGQGAVLLLDQLQLQLLVNLIIAGHLHTVRALDGQLDLAGFTGAAQIPLAVRHRGADLRQEGVLLGGFIIFPHSELVADTGLREVAAVGQVADMYHQILRVCRGGIAHRAGRAYILKFLIASQLRSGCKLVRQIVLRVAGRAKLQSARRTGDQIGRIRLAGHIVGPIAIRGVQLVPCIVDHALVDIVKVHQIHTDAASVPLQPLEVQIAPQSAAAHQIVAFQHIVGLVAAVAIRVVVGRRHEFQRIGAAVDQPIKAQIFSASVGLDLLDRQDGVAVVQVHRDLAVVEDRSILILDAQIQELRHIRRQEQVVVHHLRQGLLRGEAVVGHVHGDQVLLPALPHHRLNHKGIVRVAHQTAGRHDDPQLHGVGIAGGAVLLAGHRIDHDAVPRVIVSVLVLRAVQHHPGILVVALYQLHRGLVLVIVEVITLPEVGFCQRGLAHGVTLGILQQYPEFIHQRQDIQRGISGHGGFHGHRGILQVADAALEGDKAAGQRGCVHRQAAEAFVFDLRQLRRCVRHIRLRLVIAADLHAVQAGERQALEGQLIGAAVLRRFQLKRGNILAAGRDLAGIPFAVQAGRSPRSAVRYTEEQILARCQCAVGVRHLDLQGQGVHHIIFFRDGHHRCGLAGVDAAGDALGLQRQLHAKAVLGPHGIGVGRVGAQLRRGGGKVHAALLLCLGQRRAAHRDCHLIAAAHRRQLQLQTVDIRQCVLFEVFKAVMCLLRIIVGGIGQCQATELQSVRLCGIFHAPICRHRGYLALGHRGQLDLHQIGVEVFPLNADDLLPGRLVLILYLRIIAILVLEIYGLARFQYRQGKGLRTHAVTAQHGGAALIVVSRVDLAAIFVGSRSAAALHLLEYGEVDAAHNDAAGVIHLHIQPQCIAPRLYAAYGDLRILIGRGLGVVRITLARVSIRLVGVNIITAACAAVAARTAAADVGIAAGAAAGAGRVARFTAAAAAAAARTGITSLTRFGGRSAAAVVGRQAAAGTGAAATAGTAAAGNPASRRITGSAVCGAADMVVGVVACGGQLGTAALFIEDLLRLLHLVSVRMVIVRLLDSAAHKAQGIQQVRIVVCVPANGQGSLVHRGVLLIGNGPVLLLVPPQAILPQRQDAVDGDRRRPQLGLQHRLLHVHIQPAGQCQQDEFAAVRLGHIRIVGNAVADIEAVIASEQVHIGGQQPILLVKEAQTRSAVGIQREGQIDLLALVAYIAPGKGFVDHVIPVDLRQPDGCAAAGGQSAGDPRIGGYRKALILHGAEGAGRTQNDGRHAAQQQYNSNESFLHWLGSSLYADICPRERSP